MDPLYVSARLQQEHLCNPENVLPMPAIKGARSAGMAFMYEGMNDPETAYSMEVQPVSSKGKQRSNIENYI